MTIGKLSSSQSINSRNFGTLANGENCQLFTLISKNGCEVNISEFGAAITSIKLTNTKGMSKEICLGFDDLEGQVKDTENIGVTVGRYANRIAESSFELNGKRYNLNDNIPPHQIHGGEDGFGRKIWDGSIVKSVRIPTLRFCYRSPDGEMGYPGQLECSVTYSLSDNNALTIAYEAKSDEDTYVNLTNHAYFNLGNNKDILDHEVQIYGETITPLNSSFLVTGEIESVRQTPFDFSHPHPIRNGIEKPNSQMQLAGGYDINYVIGTDDGQLKNHAMVSCPDTGISLSVRSTQPCLQFYTGNNLTGCPERDGSVLGKHAGFCLEAQDYPNGMNVDSLPTSPLKAGELYTQTIEYRFFTDGDIS